MARKGEQFGLSKCRGCGADIVWGISPIGKKIALDPKPATYAIFWEDDKAVAYLTTEAKPVYVSHFTTCTKANEFTSAAPIPKRMD